MLVMCLGVPWVPSDYLPKSEPLPRDLLVLRTRSLVVCRYEIIESFHQGLNLLPTPVGNALKFHYSKSNHYLVKVLSQQPTLLFPTLSSTNT